MIQLDLIIGIDGPRIILLCRSRIHQARSGVRRQIRMRMLGPETPRIPVELLQIAILKRVNVRSYDPIRHQRGATILSPGVTAAVDDGTVSTAGAGTGAGDRLWKGRRLGHDRGLFNCCAALVRNAVKCCSTCLRNAC